jgi:hypothetical protein
MHEITPYLPIIFPWCLFCLSAITQPPEWVKPKRHARKVWAQSHIIAVVIASLISVLLLTHPWYSGQVVALTGATMLTYVYTQASYTDLQYRKASEPHLMYGWALFVLSAALNNDTQVVAAALVILFLTAVTRRWWAGDATALCVAVSCVTPIQIAHPEASTAFIGSMVFVLVTAVTTAVLTSSKKPIKVPLIPIALAPFLLVPALYAVLPAMGEMYIR